MGRSSGWIDRRSWSPHHPPVQCTGWGQQASRCWWRVGCAAAIPCFINSPLVLPGTHAGRILTGGCLLRLWGCGSRFPTPLPLPATPPPSLTGTRCACLECPPTPPKRDRIDEKKGFLETSSRVGSSLLVLLPVLQYMQDPGTYIGCAVPPFSVPRPFESPSK